MERSTRTIAASLAGGLACFSLAAVEAPDRNRWAVALVGGWFGLMLGALLGSRRPAQRPESAGPGEATMQCQECKEAVVFHITDARGRLAVGEKHLCDAHSRQFVESHPPPEPRAGWALPPRQGQPDAIVTAAALVGIADAPPARGGPSGRPAAAGEVLVDVVRLVISEVHEQQVVVLHEVGGGRSFSIACGLFEATNLERRLKKLSSPRPLTHDGWAATLAALGGELQDVLVNDLREQIYYTNLRIRQGGRLVAVDVRPSDAFVLAVQCGAPIFVAESVLNQVS